MRRIIVILALVALSASALAQVRSEWSGSLTARFGVDVSGDLSAAGARAQGALDGTVGSEYFPTAAFRVAIDLEADAALDRGEVRLGEAWARLFLGDVELTAGNQAVSWGSTDAVNPVDRLNPRDLRVPIDAVKLATPMVHLRAYLDGDVTLEAALLPVFVASLPPSAAWRDEPVPMLPPGMTVVETSPVRDERPAAALENVQFGVRAQWRPPGFDLAVSYLHLLRDTPTASAEIVPTGTPGEVALQPVLRYDRIEVVGIDGSVALGQFVFRAEGAYTFTRDPDGTDPTVGNPGFQVVVGGETPIPDGPRLVLQLVLDGETRDAAPDGTYGGVELAWRSMAIVNHAVDARTDLQAAWVQDFDGSGLLRPSVAYDFADGVTGTLEAVVAYGADDSRFGVWRERSGMSASLSMAF
ncbi:MAG: DUF1302 family protein [Trueperaceae bacterium]